MGLCGDYLRSYFSMYPYFDVDETTLGGNGASNFDVSQCSNDGLGECTPDGELQYQGWDSSRRPQLFTPIIYTCVFGMLASCLLMVAGLMSVIAHVKPDKLSSSSVAGMWWFSMALQLGAFGWATVHINATFCGPDPAVYNNNSPAESLALQLLLTTTDYYCGCDTIYTATPFSAPNIDNLDFYQCTPGHFVYAICAFVILSSMSSVGGTLAVTCIGDDSAK